MEPGWQQHHLQKTIRWSQRHSWSSVAEEWCSSSEDLLGFKSGHSGFCCCWVSLVFANLLVLLLFISVLLLDLLSALPNSSFVLSFHLCLCSCCFFRLVHVHIWFRKGKGEKIIRGRWKDRGRMLPGKGVIGKLCGLHGFALGWSEGGKITFHSSHQIIEFKIWVLPVIPRVLVFYWSFHSISFLFPHQSGPWCVCPLSLSSCFLLFGFVSW